MIYVKTQAVKNKNVVSMVSSICFEVKDHVGNMRLNLTLSLHELKRQAVKTFLKQQLQIAYLSAESAAPLNWQKS